MSLETLQISDLERDLEFSPFRRWFKVNDPSFLAHISSWADSHSSPLNEVDLSHFPS